MPRNWKARDKKLKKKRDRVKKHGRSLISMAKALEEREKKRPRNREKDEGL